MPAGLQHAQPAHPSEERQLPASRLQLQPEAGQDAHHQGAQKVALRQRLPPLPRDPAADEAGGRLARAVPAGQHRRLPAGRRPAVHLRPRGPAHRHVPVQVPADASDPHVQGPEAPDLLQVQHGPRRQGARLRHLGARLARVALLPARRCAVARALAWQPARPAVRGPLLQGRRQDGDQAARRVALRPRAARGGDARHLGHDARGRQDEQVAHHPAAPLRGLALLEGQHPVEGAGHAGADREHDPAVRQVQGRLVD
mmetsp:Transcript_19442/g.63360  ORF Transcript_19442/g.63360 Transcript_19442/m.63360 type:complete len:256 (+) Transcript_19442:1842-2609(+)